MRRVPALRRPAAAPRASAPPRAARAALLAAALAVAVPAAAAAAGGPDLGSEAQKEAGGKLYQKNCSQCHGPKGAGDGPAAIHLLPAPRNFTSGKFKIRTTPSGALPTHQDLMNVIRNGMPYSSMPAWPQFTQEELSDLAYYVASFSADFANPDLVPKPVDLPKPPAMAKDHKEGAQLYVDTGCVKCHGEQGRADGPSATTLKDDWGRPIRPADLTHRWTFRGGGTRADIFRTMSTGLNGTPMPSFGDALTVEQRWALTDFIVSLGPDAPDYATFVVAMHVDDPIDLAKGAALFEKAPVARVPVIGQVTEPGRSFHPPCTAVEVQAVYDADSLALRVRWNDMSAETTGRNAPNLPVPLSEETEPATAAAGGEEGAGGGGGDVWGGAEEKPAAAKPKGGDVWGEEESGSTAAATPKSEFSDAVAVQVPAQMPTGARKPYFIFGDAGAPVDLWFFDMAKKEPQEFTAKGSQDIAPNDTGDLAAAASYAQGEWSVIFKRPLRPAAGVTFGEGQFVPVAYSVWDGFTRERGNRRGLTSWSYVYVQPAVVESAAGPMFKTAGAVLLLEIVAIAWVRRRARAGGDAPAYAGTPQESRSAP